MARKMIINRLDSDELTYRGIKAGNVDEMRMLLAMTFRLEKSGDSIRYPTYPFTFEKGIDVWKQNARTVVFC